jgi:iron complex transport system permease protein
LVAPLILLACLMLSRLARGLNLLALGESEARHLGLEVHRLRRLTLVCCAFSVGAAVAFAGLIGFVGLVVPHVMRLLVGPDHRRLVPASVLGGAALLVVSDTLARTLVAPAEWPIGVLTAFLGVPFFLWLVLRSRVSS